MASASRIRWRSSDIAVLTSAALTAAVASFSILFTVRESQASRLLQRNEARRAELVDCISKLATAEGDYRDRAIQLLSSSPKRDAWEKTVDAVNPAEVRGAGSRALLLSPSGLDADIDAVIAAANTVQRAVVALRFKGVRSPFPEGLAKQLYRGVNDLDESSNRMLSDAAEHLRGDGAD